MLKRTLLYVVVMLILLGLFYSANQWDKDTALLNQFADEVSLYAEDQAKKALAWADAQPVLASKQIEEAQTQDFSVIWHKRDSVWQWSNTKNMPAPAELRWLGAQSAAYALAAFSSGTYLALLKQTDGQTRSILIPLRYALSGSPDQGKLCFPASRQIPAAVSLQATASDFPVVFNGKALCYIQAQESVQLSWLQWVKLVALALFLSVFLRFVWESATALAPRFGWITACSFVILAGGGLIILNYWGNFTQSQLGGLPLFHPNFSPSLFLGRSTGDWLLNLSVAIWGILFLHKAWPADKADAEASQLDELLLMPVTAAPDKAAGLPAALTFEFLLMLPFALGAWCIQRMVLSANQSLSFDAIIGSGWAGFALLMAMVALMVAMFLFSHRMALAVKSQNHDKRQRYTAIGIAAVAFSALAFFLNGSDTTTAVLVCLIAIAAAFLFDLYVHLEASDFSWMLYWLLVYTFFIAVTLHQGNERQDIKRRMYLASALAEARDSEESEAKLAQLYAALLQDSATLENRLKPWPFKGDVAELNARVNHFLIQYPELFNQYRASVYAFDREGQSLLLRQSYDYNAALTLWDKAQPLESVGGLRYGFDQEGKFRYLMRFALNRMGDPSQPAILWVALDQEYPTATRTYDYLFHSHDLKELTQLDLYDYAVQRNGKRIAEQGVNLSALNNAKPAAGQAVEQHSASPDRVDAVAKSKDGATLALVGRSSEGIFKLLYLFGVLFMLASILLFSLAFLNSALHFLPDSYQESLSARGSLAKRIHVSNISLLAVSFVVIGILTYRYFRSTARDNENASSNFRAEAIMANLKGVLLNSNKDSLTTPAALGQSLKTISNSLSTDANLYDVNGSLIYSSKEALVQTGLISGKMNRLALAQLKDGGAPQTQLSERSTGFEYECRYFPLQNTQGQIGAFLGIPLRNNAAKIGANLADFIGTLGSLYVFLLLVAFLVTYLLSRSIIKPLMLLAEKVKLLQLENKNEPLQYVGDARDEVSDLIVQYNAMVDKLEASKVQMVRLEREGAWREMARQVAHDIKNPLTTMKLSMQQLERVSNNPEQAAAYLRKAITRLIEQIDSLAQIASEFSMFANLDIRNKSDVVINEVVENVHYLFSEQKNVDLNLSLPTEKLHIMGDKNHLIRVFNNLIINAIQAIPSDRLGKIRVSLSRDSEMAVLKISDNGGGIPPEIRDRVFEPNFTTKTSGSGLGLAICKKIIEAHDGTIRFETRDNEGTDFFVEIPVVSVGLQMKFP